MNFNSIDPRRFPNKLFREYTVHTVAWYWITSERRYFNSNIILDSARGSNKKARNTFALRASEKEKKNNILVSYFSRMSRHTRTHINTHRPKFRFFNVFKHIPANLSISNILRHDIYIRIHISMYYESIVDLTSRGNQELESWPRYTTKYSFVGKERKIER